MLLKKICDRKFGNWFGYVFVNVWDGKGNQPLNLTTRFNGVNFETSLSEILEQAHLPVKNGRTSGQILVIYENYSFGEIYRYGNHGNTWELVGETCGYA